MGESQERNELENKTQPKKIVRWCDLNGKET